MGEYSPKTYYSPFIINNSAIKVSVTGVELNEVEVCFLEEGIGRGAGGS
jgi:hypothetical protein